MYRASRRRRPRRAPQNRTTRRRPSRFNKGGVQWKQGVVVCMLLYISLLYNTTPIHGTPSHCDPCNEYPAHPAGRPGC